MVYENKFVMCILLNDQPQKETKDGIVQIPFNSEYKIRFRNKNNKNALVKFNIDNENCSGNGYIIPPNSYIDIERFHEKNVKFKFVSIESPEAIDFGKNNNKENGIIIAQFYLQKDFPIYNTPDNKFNNIFKEKEKTNPNRAYYTGIFGYQSFSSKTDEQNQYSGSVLCTNFCYPDTNINTLNLDTNGCTVEGSVSNQNFTPMHMEFEPNSVELKIKLKGKTNQELMYKYCINCGCENKNFKFCSNCGTSMISIV